MTYRARTVMVIAGTCLLFTAAWVRAQDHLECYKVKDPLAKTTYTADIAGLLAQTGCTIQTPAKTCCVPAIKTNVVPAPPGGGGTGTPNPFCCYKVKCPKAAAPDIVVHDQFGMRAVVPKAPSVVCAPSAGLSHPFCVPECSGDVCSDTTTGCSQTCAAATAGCACVSTIDGTPACVQETCTFTACTSSADCPTGSVCFTEGCCG